MKAKPQLRLVAAAAVLATSVTAAGIAVQVPGSDRALAAGSTVTGLAFQDFNSNGVLDTTVAPGTAIDQGLPGITVRAFDASGAEVGTATSISDGTYTMTVTSELGTPLRVEFESPATGPLAEYRPSFEGSGNGTTVQFVTAGDTGVNAGFNIPGEYCQNNPSLAVSRLCAGESLQVSGNPSIFVSNYDGGPYTTANGFSDIYTSWPDNTAGESNETGAVLGMAWDSNTRRVYNTAYIRRHAEIYESGGKARPAALFVTTPDEDGTGGSTAFLVDLEELVAGDQFSNSTPGQVGYIPTNAARQLNRIEDGTGDGGSENDGVDSDLVSGKVGVYEEVGQTGIGDIEVDDEGNLYVVSLYTKQLYKVTMPADGTAPTTMTSLGDITSGVTCTNGEGRPFSITRWRGSLYLGMTCDGSGDFPADANNYNRNTTLDTNISFTVRRYDLETGQWSIYFGPQSLAGLDKGRVDGTSNNWSETSRRWNPWTNEYPTNSSGSDPFGVRPVPILSDVEFDNDGSMILGFRDRTGDQLATNGSETPIGTETFYPAIASGDLYRVCRTGTGYTAADYVFEGGTDCDPTTDPLGRNGTEYYSGDKYWSFHYEVSVGMVDQVPGFPDAIVTAFDPYDGDGSNKTFYSGGTRYVRNSTGANSPSFPNAGSGVLYFANAGNASNPNNVGGFLKTNGMSDVEALCDAAPVQIGNRVWIDTDKDGIQDPDETPVAGVTVRLYTADGATLLGTAITDEAGEYYFSSNITEDPAGDGNNQGGGLVVGDAHVVRFDEPTDYEGDGPLAGYVLTSATKGDKTTIDSDATIVADYPEISVPARTAGDNDHTFDVGFNPAIVGFGDYVWIDANANGVQDEGEAPLKDVVVNVLDANGDPVLDDNGDPITATTHENGYYFVDGLQAGDYQAEFVLPAGYGFTVTEGGASDEDSNPDRASGVTPTFSVTPADGDTVVDEDGGTLAEFVNLTIDAGVVPLVGMGDYTWIDTDEDGIQDDDEEPLAGVDVTLFEADGTTPAETAAGDPATATTDEQGYYFIDGLNFGEYQAQFDLPAGYAFTGDDGGVVEDDSNPDPTTGRTPTFTITPFEDADTDTVVDEDADTLAAFVNPTIDAGVVPLVGMGDYTWIDYDADGVQDDGEPALEGVTVTLYETDGTTPAEDAAGDPATDTTAADGSYFIDGLVPGSYTALFELPDGYVFTTDTGSPSSDDSNPDPATGLTPAFDITPRVEDDTEAENDETTLASFLNPTIDAGVVSLVAISNYFWYDEDGDGVRDPGEEPYEGGTVRLLLPNEDPATDAYGNPVPDATTDADGFFLFDDLLPGTYRLLFIPPEGYTFTTVGTTDADDDSNAARDGLTAEFTVNSRVLDATIEDDDPTTDALLVDPTVGAGLVPRVAIGDYTWEDVDLQGDQAGEPLLPGVTVELLDDKGDPALDADGEPVPSTVTNEDGLYTFDNLAPGDYSVKFTAPDGYIPTEQGTGGGDDSNPVASTGITPVFTVEPTETGDTRAVTGDDAVSVALLIDPTIDAGFIRLVGMGDYTWVDYDRDGQQDEDEPPLAGVRVRLYQPDGVTPATDAFGEPATALTDSQGYYFIDALVPGDYRAKFTLPTGYIFTRDLTGDGDTDSNPLRSTGMTPVFTIDSEVVGDSVVDTDPDTLAAFVNPTIDAGVVALVAMGNYTWIDADQDGKQDETERPLAGVTVTLYRIDGTAATDVTGAAATDVTDPNGYYFIDRLLPGVYYADFQLPAGYVFTIPRSVSSPADSNPAPTDDITLGRTPTFALTQYAGSDMMVDTDPATWAKFVDPTIDAGVVPLVAMGDYTWIDSDRDGVQDADEEPLAGVTVTLVETDGTTIVNDVDGTPATAVTDDEGLYFFDALLPGTYRTQFELPDGYVFTTDEADPASDDSNPVPTTGLTPSFTIEPQVKGDTERDTDLATRALLVNPTIDAGVVPVVAVGDYTWIDRNRDGMQDLDERPLAGVTVTLLEADGVTPATDIAGNEVTATTNDAGYYFFDGLAPGEYRVKFALPDGFVFTDDDGDDSTFDSNADPLSGVTPVFEVFHAAVGNTVADTDPDTLAGFVDPTIDAGVVRRDPREPLVAMGDYVWIDSDGDGVQDAGEPPLRGATVVLFSAAGGAPAIDVDGDPATAVTDSQGRYLIDALLPGEYQAEFRLPSGYTLTRARIGGEQTDSNPSPGTTTGVGRTPAFTLSAEVGGQMVADTDPDTRAVVKDPTIDAGAVTTTGQQGGGGSASGGGSSGGRPLPSTGLMWGLGMAWLGALLLLAGAGLVTLARRRRAA